MKNLFYGLLLTWVFASGAHAQSVEGDWEGTLKAGAAELRLVLHITKDERGGLRATFDSIDQGATGLPVTALSLTDSILKFEMQQIGGLYEGKVNAGGAKVSGTWTQGGASLPLEFARAKAKVEAKKRTPKPSEIDGDWEGTLDTGSERLRLTLHVITYEDGMTATFDSLDQSVQGLPVTTIALEGTQLKFELRQVGGGFEGSLDAEKKTIKGTWRQGGGSLPLEWKRMGAEPAAENKLDKGI